MCELPPTRQGKIMPNRIPQVDAHIAKAADFAKPILVHVRERVHSACPEVEEALKWGMPAFIYQGQILCGMAAFKQHCSLWFWHSAMKGAGGAKKVDGSMGQMGRIASLKDLPKAAEFKRLVQQAKALIDEGVKSVRTKTKKPPVKVPADLAAALKKNTKAKAAFDGFSPSHRREYVEWITEAKRSETRAKRLATTLEWLTAGKPRHWKYENC
jgi:uncharacterized protein YdeI (YjbR/CyaY-like superfamily)